MEISPCKKETATGKLVIAACGMETSMVRMETTICKMETGICEKETSIGQVEVPTC